MVTFWATFGKIRLLLIPASGLTARGGPHLSVVIICLFILVSKSFLKSCGETVTKLRLGKSWAFWGPTLQTFFVFKIFFTNGPTQASFLLIFGLFNNNFYRKIVDFSGIRTRIVDAGGKHADHLTTTSALLYSRFGWLTRVLSSLITKSQI